MKRILSIILSMLLALSVQAKKDVTTFMGVSVDGSRSKVITALKAAGCSSSDAQTLQCDFCGQKMTVEVRSSRKGVYQVVLTEKTGTENVDSAIVRYNSLIDWFRSNGEYTEYESNPYIYKTGNQNTIARYIHEKWYYAEFFQKPKGGEEVYDKPVSFYLTDDEGNYRLIVLFENRNNMPKR